MPDARLLMSLPRNPQTIHNHRPGNHRWISTIYESDGFQHRLSTDRKSRMIKPVDTIRASGRCWTMVDYF